MERKYVNGFGLTTGSYSEFINEIIMKGTKRKPGYVCIANVHMFIESYKDNAFKGIVEAADMVAPDGMPLCWYLKLKHGINQPRIAGMDLLPDLLLRMEEEQLSVYFYGGTKELLNLTGKHLKENFPALSIAGLYSPPFRSLTTREQNEVAMKINASAAQIVFVILGCPRQEKWMFGMREKINALMIGIGGALPVMVGSQRRAPRWMQKVGLEWLFRLCQEPVRLFKRYALTNSLFILLLAKDLVRSKFLRKAY